MCITFPAHFEVIFEIDSLKLYVGAMVQLIFPTDIHFVDVLALVLCPDCDQNWPLTNELEYMPVSLHHGG